MNDPSLRRTKEMLGIDQAR